MGRVPLVGAGAADDSQGDRDLPRRRVPGRSGRRDTGRAVRLRPARPTRGPRGPEVRRPPPTTDGDERPRAFGSRDRPTSGGRREAVRGDRAPIGPRGSRGGGRPVEQLVGRGPRIDLARRHRGRQLASPGAGRGGARPLGPAGRDEPRDLLARPAPAPRRELATPAMSSMRPMSRAVSSAPGRSALLTTKRSAISSRPALLAWTASPQPGLSTTIVVSAWPTTSTSTWPTPTVSSNTHG